MVHRYYIETVTRVPNLTTENICSIHDPLIWNLGYIVVLSGRWCIESYNKGGYLYEGKGLRIPFMQ